MIRMAPLYVGRRLRTFGDRAVRCRHKIAKKSHPINPLQVNKKLASVNINVADLLNGNYILLLFVVLALGLCLGKLRLGSVQLGNSIGVLVVSLIIRSAALQH